MVLKFFMHSRTVSNNRLKGDWPSFDDDNEHVCSPRQLCVPGGYKHLWSCCGYVAQTWARREGSLGFSSHHESLSQDRLCMSAWVHELAGGEGGRGGRGGITSASHSSIHKCFPQSWQENDYPPPHRNQQMAKKFQNETSKFCILFNYMFNVCVRVPPPPRDMCGRCLSSCCCSELDVPTLNEAISTTYLPLKSHMQKKRCRALHVLRATKNGASLGVRLPAGYRKVTALSVRKCFISRAWVYCLVSGGRFSVCLSLHDKILNIMWVQFLPQEVISLRCPFKNLCLVFWDYNNLIEYGRFGILDLTYQL